MIKTNLLTKNLPNIKTSGKGCSNYNQIYDFITNHKILNPNLVGFQKKKKKLYVYGNQQFVRKKLQMQSVENFNERRLNQILTTYSVVGGGLRPTSIDLQCQLMLLRIWRGHVT